QGAPGTAEPDAGRITTDADGIIVIVDGTAERLTGYAGSKLAGRTVWDVLVGDAREALTVEVLGEARSVECAQGAAIVRTDGSQFPVHLLGDAIVDAGGAVIGMVCTFWKV
ncbi:MAG TPA: PAS domain S-box protein, partial [Methanoculleus sp.]|uniref:PAS domain S-box protein n=1 Tax=Methanoculleus sp. TaxID=90427 RepID=UPI002C0413BE